MRKTFIATVISVMALVCVAPRARGAEAAPLVTYRDQVLPIFRNNCLSCHNPDKNTAGLDLSSYQSAMTGSSGGQVISPGDPDGSMVYLLITHQEQPHMPPGGGKLPDRDIEIIRNWIAGGALETSSSKAIPLAQPKPQATIAAPTTLKPDGPPPMPAELSLEPVVHTSLPGAPTALAASPWAPLVAVGGQNQVLLYDPTTGSLLGVLPFADGLPKTIRFSRNGALLMAGGGEGAKLGFVTLYDVVTGRQVARVGEEFDEVLAADVRADHAQVALGGPGKVLKMLSVATGEVVHRKTKHTDWITAVRYSPEGVLLASGDRNGGLVVWESGSGNEFHVLDGHKSAVTDVEFRPDGNVLISAGADGAIKLWDMNDGRQVKSWDAHPGGVLAIDVAHDGRIVSAGRDKVVRLWNADGGKIRDYEAMSDVALHAVLTRDGVQVVATDFAGQVRVLAAEDGKAIASLDVNPPPVAKRIEHAAARVNDLTPKKEQAATALAEAERRFAELATALAQAEARHAETTRLAEEAKVALASATTVTSSAADSLKAAEQDLAARQQAVDQLASATTMPATAPSAEVTIANEALASAQQALALRQSQMATAQQAQASAQSVMDKAASDATAAAEALRQHQEQHKAAQDALTTAKQSADAAAADLALAQAEKARWEAAAVQSSLYTVRTELGDLLERERRFVEAMTHVAQIETAIAESPAKIAAAEQVFAAARQALDVATKQRDEVVASLASRESIEQRARELSLTLRALADQSPENGDLASAARAAQESHDKLVADRSAKTQATEAAVAAAQAALTSAEAEVAKAKAESEALPTQLTAARDVAASLASAPIAAAQARLVELESKYQQLKQSVPPQ